MRRYIDRNDVPDNDIPLVHAEDVDRMFEGLALAHAKEIDLLKETIAELEAKVPLSKRL
jgi:hypothetical protein